MTQRNLKHKLPIIQNQDRFRNLVASKLTGMIGSIKMHEPAEPQGLRRGRISEGLHYIPYHYFSQIDGKKIRFAEIFPTSREHEPAFLQDIIKGRHEQKGVLINVNYLFSPETSAAACLDVIKHRAVFNISQEFPGIEVPPRIFRKPFGSEERNHLFTWLTGKGMEVKNDLSEGILPFIKYRSIGNLVHGEPKNKRDERSLAARLITEQLKSVLAYNLFLLEDGISGNGWKGKNITDDESRMAAYASTFILSHPFYALSNLAHETYVHKDENKASSYLALLYGNMESRSLFFARTSELMKEAMKFLSEVYHPTELAKRIGLFGKGISRIIGECFKVDKNQSN